MRLAMTLSVMEMRSAWIPINHECGLEEAKGLPHWRLFGPFADPRLGRHIVSEEEGSRVWVGVNWWVKEGCGGCDVIDDDGCIF